MTQDELEYWYLFSKGYEGWAQLSSGHWTYIKQPMASAAEMGDALSKILGKMREDGEYAIYIK